MTLNGTFQTTSKSFVKTVHCRDVINHVSTWIYFLHISYNTVLTATPPDLEAKFDELALRINADAIRYATGGWVTSMAQA